MAQITIDIPNTVIQRVTTAFTKEFGYQSTDQDGQPNPQTPAQFTKAQVIEYIKQVTRNYEASLAAQAARAAKESEINSVNIT